MIDLTPLDVRKKKEDFRKAVRGYDTGEVDNFLDMVADRMEELVREQRILGDRVETLEERLSHYEERERALNEALLAAQELREEARSQAERSAAARLREAETHAEAILLEADQAIRHSQQRLREIHSQRERFLRSLRGLLQRFADNLEVEETRLQEEPDDLGDLLHKLERESRGFRRAGPEPTDGRRVAAVQGDEGSEGPEPGVQGRGGDEREGHEGDRTDDAAAAPPESRGGDEARA